MGATYIGTRRMDGAVPERNNSRTKSRCRGEPFYRGGTSSAGVHRNGAFSSAHSNRSARARCRESNFIEFGRADSIRRYRRLRARARATDISSILPLRSLSVPSPPRLNGAEHWPVADDSVGTPVGMLRETIGRSATDRTGVE